MVIRWLVAMMLLVVAAAGAGITGMFFEESRVQFTEGKAKAAMKYGAMTIGVAVSTIALAYVGAKLVQK